MQAIHFSPPEEPPGSKGSPPGEPPGSKGIQATSQVSLDPNTQQFSAVLAKQLADLHTRVLQMHMNDMFSHQLAEAKDSDSLSPPAWEEPKPVRVGVTDMKQPRVKWEPKLQFQPSPRQTDPVEPDIAPGRWMVDVKGTDGKASDGGDASDKLESPSSVPPSPTSMTSPGPAFLKGRSLWSQEAQPCPNHPLPVKQKMPNTASRQVTRIDDFDDIVTKGYTRLRKKRRNISTDPTVDPKSRHRRKMINSLFLEPCICAVLVINAIQIGVSMDVASDATWWAYVDLTFVTIYTIELFFKIILLGWKEFFSHPQVWFNLFDVVIITLALVGVVLTLSYSSDSSGQMSNSIVIVRLVRLARITRIIRLLRFAIFKELLTMIAGLVSGLRTLLWAFVLLFLAIYPMSLVLTQFLGQDDSTKNDWQMRELFKSVPRSMLTVFRCVTGDCNYSDGTPVILELVEKYGAVWIPIYVCVMLIVTFGLFNLIMAIFVDNALADAKRQERELKLARLKDREMQKEKTAHLLEMLLDRIIEESLHHGDAENSRDLHEGLEKVTHMSVSKEVFNDFMLDPEVTAILDALDVPEEERLDLFEVLDANGNGTLQLEELINGVIKLRGDPRRSDTIHVLLVIRSLQEEMQDFKDAVFQKMEAVHDTVAMICNVTQ